MNNKLHIKSGDTVVAVSYTHLWAWFFRGECPIPETGRQVTLHFHMVLQLTVLDRGGLRVFARMFCRLDKA